MCINMNIGGTEKALLTMLNEMDRRKYDITLFMLEEHGGFLNQIPDGIKVMYLKEYKTLKKFINDPPQLVAKELIKNRKIIKGLSVLFVYIIHFYWTKIPKIRTSNIRFIKIIAFRLSQFNSHIF